MLKIINWWLDIDPFIQFLAWLTSFALLLICGICMIIGISQYGLFTAIFQNLWIMTGMICGFISYFMCTILFFTILWNGKTKITDNKLETTK